MTDVFIDVEKVGSSERFDALNRTAWALTERGLSFEAAERLHGEAVLAV